MSRRNAASDAGPRLRSICHDVSGITGAGAHSSPRCAEQFGAAAAICVVGVGRGEQHAGVDDYRHDVQTSRAARPIVCSARISRCRRARSPRPDDPDPMNASSGSSAGNPAAMSATSWSRVMPRRVASVWRRAWASAGRSSVTVTGSIVEGRGDSPTGQRSPRPGPRSFAASLLVDVVCSAAGRGGRAAVVNPDHVRVARSPWTLEHDTDAVVSDTRRPTLRNVDRRIRHRLEIPKRHRVARTERLISNPRNVVCRICGFSITVRPPLALHILTATPR